MQGIVSVQNVYSFADGGTFILYTWDKFKKEVTLDEVKELIAKAKDSQEMALQSQKTKKDGTTSECCDTVGFGSPDWT